MFAKPIQVELAAPPKPISRRKESQNRRIKNNYISSLRNAGEEEAINKDTVEKAVQQMTMKASGFEINFDEGQTIRNYVFNKGLHGCGDSSKGMYRTLFHEMLGELNISSQDIPIVDIIKVSKGLSNVNQILIESFRLASLMLTP